MKLNVKTNLVSGIIAILFAVALWIVIPIEIVDRSTKLIKSDFLPRLIAIVIFLCGGILVYQGIAKPGKEKTIVLDLKKELRVVLYMAALVLYTFLFDKIGFLLSSLLLAVFTLLFVREKKLMRYVIVVIYVTALFFLFKYALGVPFPTILLA